MIEQGNSGGPHDIATVDGALVFGEVPTNARESGSQLSHGHDELRGPEVAKN